MIVDFDYYKNVFCGGAITSPAVFCNLELKAVAYIDKITFGKITEPITKEVKNAVCSVCEVLHKKLEHSGIASESNDGYSVSYTQVDEAEIAQEMYSAACMFLPSELLYRGL